MLILQSWLVSQCNRASIVCHCRREHPRRCPPTSILAEVPALTGSWVVNFLIRDEVVEQVLLRIRLVLLLERWPF